MFRRKNEKRGIPPIVILGVGALAALGIVSITEKSANFFAQMKNKIMGMFGNKSSCIPCEDACEIE